jgi:hypothetical protein
VAIRRLRISRSRGQLARPALRRRPDVVQVHNPPDFLVSAALLPEALGARVVLDIHDLSSDMFEMWFFSLSWVLPWLALGFLRRMVLDHSQGRVSGAAA